MREAQKSTVCSKLACIRHNVAIPVFSFTEPSENSTRAKIRVLAKIGQLKLMIFSRYQNAHIRTRAFGSGDDDDTVPLQ